MPIQNVKHLINKLDEKVNLPAPIKKYGKYFIKYSTILKIGVALTTCIGAPSLFSSTDIENNNKDLKLATDDVIIGATIIDPEFYSDGTNIFVTYQNKNGVTVVSVDPSTGLFENTKWNIPSVAPLSKGVQGPEWGFSELYGPAVFFSDLENQSPQVARAYLSDLFEYAYNPTEILTHKGKNTSLAGNIAAHANKNGIDSNQITYFKIKPEGYHWYWIDDIDPEKEHIIYDDVHIYTQPPRWIKRSTPVDSDSETFASDLIFSSLQKDNSLQIVRYDTEKEQSYVLTNDFMRKEDPEAFFAPEYNNNLVYTTTGNFQTIQVYEQRGGDYDPITWSHSIRIPPSELAKGYKFISSVEPIVTEKTSFLVVRLMNSYENSHIWIWSLDGSFKYEVDDGSEQARVDPEVIIGKDSVFVYYSVYTGEGRGLHLCQTPISSDGTIITD